MAIDLKSLRTSSADVPPRLLIYGPEGIGKNTLSLEFPDPLTLDLERGVPPGFVIADEDDIPDFASLMELVDDLINKPHEFKTVIFDSLDKIQSMIFTAICEQEGWDTIEKPGFGAGYKIALVWWEAFMREVERLNKSRNVCVIFLAHSAVVNFNDPGSASYSRFTLRLNEKAAGVIKDRCDAVLFINQDIAVAAEDPNAPKGAKKNNKATGSGTRWMRAEMRPAYDAKNRYGIPDKFQYKLGEGYAFLSEYLPGMDTPVVEVEEAEAVENDADAEQDA